NQKGMKKINEEIKALYKASYNIQKIKNEQEKTNEKIGQGVDKAKNLNKELGKDVKKDVKVDDNKTADNVHKKATKSGEKKVKVDDNKTANKIHKEATKPATKKVTLNAVWKNVQSGLKKALSNLKFWEKGTPTSGHPGGLAVVGERGSELITLPDGRSFLSPGTHTLLNLPRGTHVIPHHETKRIIRNAPRYADGTRNWDDALGNSEFARLLVLNGRISEQNVVRRASGNTSNNQLIALL